MIERPYQHHFVTDPVITQSVLRNQPDTPGSDNAMT
jgi:hypothetical protein